MVDALPVHPVGDCWLHKNCGPSCPLRTSWYEESQTHEAVAGPGEGYRARRAPADQDPDPEDRR